MIADEVHSRRVQLIGCPLDEVIRGWSKVHNPEATEKCRVHIFNCVLSASVHTSDDPSIRVKGVWNTVFVVAELAIQDELECRLLNANESSVELIEADKNWLVACSHEPRRHAESHNSGLFHSFKIRIATYITLAHSRETNIEEREFLFVGNSLCEE